MSDMNEYDLGWVLKFTNLKTSNLKTTFNCSMGHTPQFCPPTPRKREKISEDNALTPPICVPLSRLQKFHNPHETTLDTTLNLTKRVCSVGLHLNAWIRNSWIKPSKKTKLNLKTFRVHIKLRVYVLALLPFYVFLSQKCTFEVSWLDNTQMDYKIFIILIICVFPTRSVFSSNSTMGTNKSAQWSYSVMGLPNVYIDR